VKYFFLALILTIVQPLLPLPRQTVNKQAEKTSAKSQISNKGQNPPDPAPSIVVVNNCSNEDASTNAAKNETPNLHPDSQKQPEPWSRSDKLILTYDILTGLLVFIALCTGIAVAFQARETARATKAMADNTRALTLSQGPQIGFCPAKDHPARTLAEGTPRIEIGIINRGPTTAYDCTYESWIEVLPFPFTDFTSEADHAEILEKFALHPNSDKPITVNIPYRKGLTAIQRKDIETLNKFACIRLRVSYRDVFSDKPTRFAEFGLYAMLQGFGFLPKYNNSN